MLALLNQVRLPERLQHAVLEFVLVESFGRIGSHCDRDLASKISEVRDGVPRGKQLVPVG